MYFKESMKYAKWILENAISKGEMDVPTAERIHKTFHSSGNAFNEYVHKKSMEARSPVTEELLQACTFNALKQIWEETRKSTQNVFSQQSFGNFQPQIGNNFSFKDERIDTFQQVNQAAKNIYQSHSSPVAAPEASGNNLQFVKPTVAPSEALMRDEAYHQEQEMEEAVVLPEEHVEINLINVKEKYHELTTDQKFHSKVMGTTKTKMDNGTYSLQRNLAQLTNQQGEESFIKYDMMNLSATGAKIVFDSVNDMVEYLNGQMSREDITTPFFRWVFYHSIKRIEIDQDLFFREYGKLQRSLVDDEFLLQPGGDLFDNTEIYLRCIEVMQKKDPTFVGVFQQFLLDELNGIIEKYIRFRETPKRIIKFTSLVDIEAFVQSGKYAPLRKFPDFEKVLNNAVKHIVQIMQGDGKEMVFCPLESEWEYVYTNTRKYQVTNGTMNGLTSLDYAKYTDSARETVKAALKEQVLVCIPNTDVITNIYSANFIRHTMFINKNHPRFVSSNFEKTSPNNLIWTLLYQRIMKDKTKPAVLPDRIIYSLSEENRKVYRLNLTLSREIIMS